MSLERQFIYNPKPDGSLTGKAVWGSTRHFHYKNDHYKGNGETLYVYADNGDFVLLQEPIWIYSRGLSKNGYYTIENRKPREVLVLSAYDTRLHQYFAKHPDADRSHVDVSAKCIEVVYNNAFNANNPYLYVSGSRKNQQVLSDVAIQKILLSEENGKHIYYVITEDGHIDPIVPKKLIKSRAYSLEYNKLKRYKKKVQEVKEIKKEKEREQLSIKKEDLVKEREKEIKIEIEVGKEKELPPIIKSNINKQPEAVSLSQQGLFTQPKIEELKKKAVELTKNNKSNNTIIKTGSAIVINERINKLQKKSHQEKAVLHFFTKKNKINKMKKLKEKIQQPLTINNSNNDKRTAAGLKKTIEKLKRR